MKVKDIERLIREDMTKHGPHPTLVELHPADWSSLIQDVEHMHGEFLHSSQSLVDQILGLRAHTATDLEIGEVNFYYSITR